MMTTAIQNEPNNPRSRGCGPRERILPWYHSVIPGLVNPHRITDEQMVVLNAMHLEAGRIVYGALHEHHRRKERKHHGRRGLSSRAFIPGDLPVMIAQIETDLPLDH